MTGYYSPDNLTLVITPQPAGPVAERAAASEPAAPNSANSSVAGSIRPADRDKNKYFCCNGQHYCKRDDFTSSQLNKGTGIGRDSTISCRKHTKGTIIELKCMGYCERVLPITSFSKSQRNCNSSKKCSECIEYQLSLEPGRMPLPPPGKHQREFQEEVLDDKPFFAVSEEDENTTGAATTSAASTAGPANGDDTSTVISQAISTASRSSTWTKISQRRTQYTIPTYLNHDASLDEETYFTDGSADEC